MIMITATIIQTVNGSTPDNKLWTYAIITENKKMKCIGYLPKPSLKLSGWKQNWKTRSLDAIRSVFIQTANHQTAANGSTPHYEPNGQLLKIRKCQYTYRRHRWNSLVTQNETRKRSHYERGQSRNGRYRGSRDSHRSLSCPTTSVTLSFHS